MRSRALEIFCNDLNVSAKLFNRRCIDRSVRLAAPDLNGHALLRNHGKRLTDISHNIGRNSRLYLQYWHPAADIFILFVVDGADDSGDGGV